MAQIVSDYDLSLGSTEVAAATGVNNVRFQYVVTGATPEQKVVLNPLCSEDDTNYNSILKENLHPFSFTVSNNGAGSKRIMGIGSAFVKLQILCDGCTGTLNVYTHES